MVIGIILVIIYFKVLRGRAGRRLSAANLKSQIADLSNLSHILVIYKQSGIELFSQTFAYEHLDSTLLSGLLEAMNIMGSKIGAKGKLRRLEYEKYRILIHEGRWIRGFAMSKEEPSAFLEDALTVFVKRFENKFAGSLMDFRGEVSKFEAAVELVDECFCIALIYPMTSAWDGQNPEELTDLEKKILEIAKEVCVEKGTFLIPDLIEILRGKLKKSPDTLLSIVYDLHKRQYLLSRI
ncbi:MAG: hypothetical protein LUQ65_04175 [Candidatus Helarchaeota archaeon]|nr:hypothetical protein [Candidatus Helarchaeota archaeon]